MFNIIFKSVTKPLSAMLIITVLVMAIPVTSKAQLAVDVAADTSPTGIMNFVNHQMQHLKDFVLDHLATLIAKQILHQLTMSVVNWINSGFKGSPAFLTDPQGFFLDVADQVTGAYLATDGPLSTLCSPFAIDIRLSLALSQAALTNQRYTCTLSQIIKAQSGGPTVMINGKTVLAANSINGFTGGDFNQGGWPAFITMTTESQNNPYGAFLSAQSDLYATIGSKQNTIHADLQLGQGFMSWQSCKDVPGGSHIDVEQASAEGAGIEAYSNDPKLTQTKNKDGTVSFQQCETQTPGSVIAGTLQTNLNVPVVELELANDINAVVNALVTQMVSTMLSSGLHALSGGSSGGGASYTQQVINDANSNTAAQASLGNLQASIGPAIDQINSYLAIYDQAINILNDSRTRYNTARACFVNRIANPSLNSVKKYTFQDSITYIDNQIDNQIVPQLNNMNDAYANGLADRRDLEDMTYAVSGTGSAAEVQKQANNYAAFVQSGGMNMQPKIDAAQTALSTAQTQAQTFNTDSAQLLQECQNTQ